MNYTYPEWAKVGKFVDFEDEQWLITDRFTVFGEGREWGAVYLRSTAYMDVEAAVMCRLLGDDPAPPAGLQA